MDPLTWQRATRSEQLHFLAGQPGSTRKLRLFAAACCRRVMRWLGDERCRQAVELAERLADDWAGPVEVSAAVRAAEEALRDAVIASNGAGADAQIRVASEARMYAARAALYCLTQDADTTAESAAHAAACTVPRAPLASLGWVAAYRLACQAERDSQKALLDEVFGDPFDPVFIRTDWLTADVRGLARVLYEERRFGEVPVLADALEDAGCTEQRLLGHLRGPVGHVRGCFAVDLLLGKA